MNLPQRNLELSNLFEIKLKWRHGINTAIIRAAVIGFSEKVYQQSILQRTWECLLERLYAWSHTLWKMPWQGFRTLPETSESEGRKQTLLWLVWSHSLTSCQPKVCNCGLQKHLLHSCVGCTADVTGDHHQAARMEARHHRSQIALEPQLKVFRLKVFKFRSKGCQGQVQDGVPYNWSLDEGDVTLKNIGGFMFQFRRTFYLSEITVEMRASLVTHICTSVHLGHDSRHRWQQFTQQDDWKCSIFSQSLGPY